MVFGHERLGAVARVRGEQRLEREFEFHLMPGIEFGPLFNTLY